MNRLFKPKTTKTKLDGNKRIKAEQNKRYDDDKRELNRNTRRGIYG